MGHGENSLSFSCLDAELGDATRLEAGAHSLKRACEVDYLITLRP